MNFSRAVSRFFYSLCLFGLLAIPAVAMAARPTIAVLDFNADKASITIAPGFVVVQSIEDTTRLLSSDLMTYLVKTNKFDVVERSRMKDILTEQEFSESGYISPESAVKMGNLIGADYFVMGKIEMLKAGVKRKKIPYTDTVRSLYVGKMIVNVRIVDSRGGKIVTAEKFTVEHEDRNPKGELTADEFLEALKEKTVKEIVNGVVAGVFPLKIAKVTGNTVYINRGSGVDFEVGDHLSVLAQGEGLIDPDTGESLGSAEEEVGVVEVTSIQQKFSKAKIISGEKNIKKGALVRSRQVESEESVSMELTPGSSDKPFSW
ncbi:MAG: CsgG/HfaB family protein [Gammaproteobacteria bacterium]|nr:CsgG/HfaB family protein [Gammaproteobacteria bacterium]